MAQLPGDREGTWTPAQGREIMKVIRLHSGSGRDRQGEALGDIFLDRCATRYLREEPGFSNPSPPASDARRGGCESAAETAALPEASVLCVSDTDWHPFQESLPRTLGCRRPLFPSAFQNHSSEVGFHLAGDSCRQWW